MTQSNATRTGVTIDVRRAVRERLAEVNAVVVIDDFHYAPDEVRKQLARSLKDLSSRRVPIVLIAVPHRVLDLVKSEEELLGRVVRKKVAHWSPLELMRIAALGFAAMNVDDRKGKIADRLVAQSFGSPLLMQELSGEVCRRNSMLETLHVARDLKPPDSWPAFFANVAADLEHPLAQALRAGPQERKRRKQRRLRDLDLDVDTYGAVLLGLRDRLPATSTSLTELTDAVNAHLEQRLQLQEVRRVCREMRKRAEQHRKGGDAPIDVSESAPERLTIVDPYLAFYIAWGLESLGLPSPS
jgi:hypothetical protein